MNAYTDLYSAWQQLQHSQPKLRAREAAQHLGISEAELLECRRGQDSIHRLRSEPAAILQTIEKLGRVMALTRNNEVVHERKGLYSNLSFQGPMGLALNPDIDLRLFMNHWYCAFAVSEQGRHSLQFFDRAGVAVHKIYLLEESDQQAYQALLGQFIEPSPAPLHFTPYPQQPDLADEQIVVAALRQDWLALQDVHDYHAMLRKHKCGRQQALRLVGEDLAQPLPIEAIAQILQRARDQQCEIMVFVGNRGCIQIHTGPVQHLAATGPWYNVLDEAFNLHINLSGLAQAWIVRRPSSDGPITSIEVFNQQGESVLTLFGKRKPGQPELLLWQSLVAELSASLAA